MSKQFLDEIHKVLIGKKLTLDASKPKFQIKSHMQKSQFLGRFTPNFAWQIPFLDAEIHHLSQLRPQGPLAAPRHFSTAAARHKGGRRRCTGGVSVGQTCPAAGTEKPGKGIQSGGWLYVFFGWRVFFLRGCCGILRVQWVVFGSSVFMMFMHVYIYIHTHIHKLNLDQSFLGLPNFDPGGYDTIYETQEEVWWKLRL